MHSFLRLDSLLYMVVKRFDNTFRAGIPYHLLVFCEPQAGGHFSETLSAEHQVILSY